MSLQIDLFYKQLVGAALQKGVVQATVTINPLFFTEVKVALKNRKARDLMHKQHLAHISFLDMPEEQTLQITLDTTTKYKVENDLVGNADSLLSYNFN